jgi:AraC family transcriptional regulator
VKPDTATSYHERLYRVLAHIERNLDGPLPLNDLARIAGFSAFHFHRVFRGMVGESVADHVRRLRLERAASRLRTTDDAILDIAFDSGYEAHESFTRAFFAAYGESPSSFRRSNGPVRRGPAEMTHDIDVRIEFLPRKRIAYLRHTGAYETVGATWQRLMMWAGWHGLLGPGMQLLGRSWDDPEVTPPEKIRYDAALVVPDHVKPEPDITIDEIGGCEYGKATHRGPYSQFYRTYASLCGVAIPRSGREMADTAPLEFYRNSPQTAQPEDLITDIYVPLRDLED